MSTERLEFPAVSLVCGQGRDLPSQAARLRASWLEGREGRAPLLLVALLWGRECPDVVRQLQAYLDALFVDYACTPAGWSEAQAVRQVLAALNQQLFRQQQAGRGGIQLSAGLLLLQGDEVQFFQAGAIGLLRYREGSLQSLAGREGMQLGGQAELALVQHHLPLSPGEVLLLAPQPLLDVADLHSFRTGCAGLEAEQMQPLLRPLLQAPGAAVLLLPGVAEPLPPAAPREPWPVLVAAQPGQQLDGWTLLGGCAFGPPGRVFRAMDERGREAILWLAEQAADEAFWQREWALRRSAAASLAQVLSAHQPRRHAFMLFEPAPPGMLSLLDWQAAHGPLEALSLLALLEQLIAAVRALQRRGMQCLWLDPRNILVGGNGRLLLLPEHAALLPGVPRQPLPAEALPLAPELRQGQMADGRADQFALAALAYWLFCGRWPEVARADAGKNCGYVPLAQFSARLPAGWDGVLARALAPQAEARFEALSEFHQALLQPLQAQAPQLRSGRRQQPWQVVMVGLLVVQLALGLWLSLNG